MNRISAVIITKNEENNIEGCLQSVKWADEIIAVDSISIDRTVEICKRYTNKVYLKPFESFEKQKNYGAEMASSEWIFSIDADERCTEELERELRAAAERDDFDGYKIPLKNYFLGRYIKYVYGNAAPLRFYRKDKGIYEGYVHEKFDLNGKAGILNNYLIHIGYKSIDELISKIPLYTNLEAKMKYERGEEFSIFKAILSALHVVWLRLIKLRGYKDGTHGIVIVAFMAIYILIIHFKLWELHNKEDKPETT